MLKHESYACTYMLSCVLKVFYAFLALSHIKEFNLGLFGMKHGTQNYLVYIIGLFGIKLGTQPISYKILWWNG